MKENEIIDPISRQIQNEGRNKNIQRLTKHSVDGIHGDLVLCGISNETLWVGERDIRRSSSVTLVVCDDLDPVVLPNPHARVRRPEIDSDRRPFALASHLSEWNHERAASKWEESKEIKQWLTLYRPGLGQAVKSPILRRRITKVIANRRPAIHRQY